MAPTIKDNQPPLLITKILETAHKGEGEETCDVLSIVHIEEKWFSHVWKEQEDVSQEVVEYVLSVHNNCNMEDVCLKVRLLQILISNHSSNNNQQSSIQSLLTSLKPASQDKKMGDLTILLFIRIIHSKLQSTMILPVFWKHICTLISPSISASVSEEVISTLISLIQQGQAQISSLSTSSHDHAWKLLLFFVTRLIVLLRTFLQINPKHRPIWNQILSCLILLRGMVEFHSDNKNDITHQLSQKVTACTCSLVGINEELMDIFIHAVPVQDTRMFWVGKATLIPHILAAMKSKKPQQQLLEYVIFSLLPSCQPYIMMDKNKILHPLISTFVPIFTSSDERDDHLCWIRWTYPDKYCHPLSREIILHLMIHACHSNTKLMTWICQLILNPKTTTSHQQNLAVILYQLLLHPTSTKTLQIFLHTLYNNAPKKSRKRQRKKKKTKISSPTTTIPLYIIPKHSIRVLSPLLESISSTNSFWSNKNTNTWWDSTIRPYLTKLILDKSKKNRSYSTPTKTKLSLILAFLTGSIKQDPMEQKQQNQNQQSLFFQRTGFKHTAIFDLTIHLLLFCSTKDCSAFISNALRFCYISFLTFGKTNDHYVNNKAILQLIKYLNQQCQHEKAVSVILWDYIQLLSKTSFVLNSGSPQELTKIISDKFFNLLDSDRWTVVSYTMTCVQNFSLQLMTCHKKMLLSCIPPQMKLLFQSRLLQQKNDSDNSKFYSYSDKKSYLFHVKTEIMLHSKENLIICKKHCISSSCRGNYLESVITILPGSNILKLTDNSRNDGNLPLIILPPKCNVSSIRELLQNIQKSPNLISYIVKESCEKNGYNKVRISAVNSSNYF